MNDAVSDVGPARCLDRLDRPEDIGDLVSFLESNPPGKHMLGVG
jgi:hypothetical protein